jgi:nucleotide-binding universal stress UspA family protein
VDPLQDANRTIRPGVIVGTDGTPSAAPAIRWAAAEAVLRDHPLRIVHAAPYAVGPTAGPGRVRAAEVLAAASTVARRAEPGCEISTHCTANAPVPSLIAASRGACLLVVGIGGTGLPRDAAIGSTAVDVSGRAHCPVVVVRGRHRSATRSRPVLVGVDVPETETTVLNVAFAEAHRHGGGLVVVHAEHDGPGFPGHHPPRAEPPEAGESPLAAALEPWSQRHPEVPIDLRIVPAHPAAALLGAAVQVRLLVVGRRGRSAPVRALFGSTSRAMLRRSPVPVMVVPAGVAASGGTGTLCPRCGGADDRDGAAGPVDGGVADRPQHEAGELPVAPRTDDE